MNQYQNKFSRIKFKHQKDHENKKRDKDNVIEKEKELKKKETTHKTVTSIMIESKDKDIINQMKKDYLKRVVEIEIEREIRKNRLKRMKSI
jgi:hypothetical protein